MAYEEAVQFIQNKNIKSADSGSTAAFLDKDAVESVRAFHKSFPQYRETPLADLSSLAQHLEVEDIWVKDESYRFGLNAFKVLGGSYAIGKYLAEKLDMDISELSFEMLRSNEIKERLGDITFVTATDGNHGRGIAWAARELGQKSVVFMPKGSSEIRLQNIRNEGATASITDMNYDDAVRLADSYARENNGVLVQDSSWPGYEKIPTWIMQGYATIMDEAIEQIKEQSKKMPTHVFLQAGVGSFAGSMLGYLVSAFGDERPISAIIEPLEAACIYKSAKINDGEPHAVTGFMPTIMAGLACGEPSTVAWGILRDYSDVYIACPDLVAAKGMRILGNPMGTDVKVISGESGAVGLGLLAMTAKDQKMSELKAALKIDKDSRILIVSTEGDTDPQGYRDIVWGGKYPSF